MSDSQVLKHVSSEMDEDFHRPSFMRIVRGGFNVEKVKIPSSFWKSKKGPISSDGATILNGPFGGSWPVQVSPSYQGVFLTEGWTKFSEDHGLVENDLVVFHLAGHSSFDVQIFGDNGSEKERDPLPEVPIVKKKKRGRPSKNKDATNLIPIEDGTTYSSADLAPPPIAELAKPQAGVAVVKKKRGRTCKNKDATIPIPIVYGDTYSLIDPANAVTGGGPSNDQEVFAVPSNKEAMFSRKGKILAQYSESLRDKNS